ncbi:MAG: UDP-glucose--hexose-1-phosphate uridylyltransferase [bacterium]
MPPAATATFDLTQHVHRRWNPLVAEWVLVSPHRTQRPWQGQSESIAAVDRPAFDPSCYLCPGNPRAGGATTPRYEHTYVFDNDFPGLLPDEVHGTVEEVGGLVHAAPVRGVCRVVCFSPRHDLSLGQLGMREVRRVIDTWADETTSLGNRGYIRHVLVFENRGAMMGASNPHPHGQIWATEEIPNEVAREVRTQSAYWRAHQRPLLLDYLAHELADGARVVLVNDHFAALVPFWAVWPFETLVLPRRNVGSLADLEPGERDALAGLMRRLCARYDRVFDVPFPYTMGWHQRPTDGDAHPGFLLHAHYYPPLLRSATVRKFMVGFEMLGEPQRDIPAEAAAQRLRDVGDGG